MKITIMASLFTKRYMNVDPCHAVPVYYRISLFNPIDPA
jgi:hypothetical protein